MSPVGHEVRPTDTVDSFELAIVNGMNEVDKECGREYSVNGDQGQGRSVNRRGWHDVVTGRERGARQGLWTLASQ